MGLCLRCGNYFTGQFPCIHCGYYYDIEESINNRIKKANTIVIGANYNKRDMDNWEKVDENYIGIGEYWNDSPLILNNISPFDERWDDEKHWSNVIGKIQYLNNDKKFKVIIDAGTMRHIPLSSWKSLIKKLYESKIANELYISKEDIDVTYEIEKLSSLFVYFKLIDNKDLSLEKIAWHNMPVTMIFICYQPRKEAYLDIEFKIDKRLERSQILVIGDGYTETDMNKWSHIDQNYIAIDTKYVKDDNAKILVDGGENIIVISEQMIVLKGF